MSSARLGDCNDDDFCFIDENKNNSDENDENYVETETRKKGKQKRKKGMWETY